MDNCHNYFYSTLVLLKVRSVTLHVSRKKKNHHYRQFQLHTMISNQERPSAASARYRFFF